MQWPEGKHFAFTIIDDTDNSFVGNIAPIYQLLGNCGIYTTKTVWVYPSRDAFTGHSLADAEYLNFIRGLSADGFEIALHGVGSGHFGRNQNRIESV